MLILTREALYITQYYILVASGCHGRRLQITAGRTNLISYHGGTYDAKKQWRHEGAGIRWRMRLCCPLAAE